MATKPTEKPTWATTEPGNVVTPPGGKQTDGWDPNEVPVSQWQNWLHKRTLDWINYFEEVIDAGAQLGNFTFLTAQTNAGRTQLLKRFQRRIRNEQKADVFRAAVW